MRLLSVAALLAISAVAVAQPKVKLALTWDDLPINGTLPAGAKQSDFARDTVKVLRKYRIPPSYGFINAVKLEGDPDGALALRIWAAAGHPLGNHTYTHLDLTKNSAEDFLREVTRNEPVLELLMPEGGRHDWRWFRYPYLHEGDTLEKRNTVRAALAANHYRIAQTTLDFEDYLWNSAHARCWAKHDTEALAWLRSSYLDTARTFVRAQREHARLVFGRDINHVMLLHLGSFSSHILPDLFQLLRDEGFVFVSLEEAQSDPAYDTDSGFVGPWGGTLVEQLIDARKVDVPRTGSKPRDRLREICN